MKKYYKALFTVTTIIITLSACKLDEAVVPTPQPAVNDATVIGITINKLDIDDAYLTASWKTTSTTLQYYDTDRVVISGVGIANIMNGVKLNDKAKSYQYIGLATPFGDPEGNYRLVTDQNVLFIDMAANPFFDSSVISEVRITNLSETGMTWLAINNEIIQYNGQPARLAYQITFTKQR